MMPLGAPSISKYGSLVRPDAQIVALRAHWRALRLRRPLRKEEGGMKSCSICASTIDQCVHTSIAPCHALTQPCYALPCLDTTMLRLAMP